MIKSDLYSGIYATFTENNVSKKTKSSKNLY